MVGFLEGVQRVPFMGSSKQGALRTRRLETLPPFRGPLFKRLGLGIYGYFSKLGPLLGSLSYGCRTTLGADPK